MLQTCRTIDLRSQAEDEFYEALDQLHPNQALLLISKTSFPLHWTLGAVWRLIEGPSIHHTVFTHSILPEPRLRQQRSAHQRWLDAFGALHDEASKGRDVAEAATQLVESILEQQRWEEQAVYPAVSRFLGDGRAVRELTYEHLGMQRLLPTFLPCLQALHPSHAGDDRQRRRTWEQFRLDVVHLLEHHIEHEEKGVYPLYERLADPAPA